MSGRFAARHQVILALVVTSILAVYAPGAKLPNKKSKTDTQNDLGNMIRPQLIDSNGDAMLRFPVMCTTGSDTYGWLDIGNSRVSYSVVQPTKRSDRNFVISRYEVKDLRFNKNILSFRSTGDSYEFIYVPQGEWGKVHTALGGLGKEASRESIGTQSIYKTFLNFDRVMAMVNPAATPSALSRPTPQPQPSSPSSAPVIVLSTPEGVTSNQTVNWQESNIVVRGVAMDSGGIPLVKINGTAANMRPQTSQAAEFWSDPMQLRPGSNSIQIVASSPSQVQSTLGFTINYKPKPENPRGLEKQNIVGLLQGGVPSARVTELVRERGLKFSPTTADLNEIRAAGGTEELIQAIRQAAQ